MSVVNKMLRDLDSRRSGGHGIDYAGTPGPARGVAAVADLAPAPRRLRGWPLAGLLAALLVGAASLGGWWSQQQPVQPPDRAAPAVAVVRAPGALSTTVANSAAPQSPPAPVLHQPANQSVPVAAALALPVVATPPRDPPEPKFFRMETALRSLPKNRSDAAGPAPTPSASVPSPVERPASVKVVPRVTAEVPAPVATSARRQAATAELMEQAQRLWNSGSREAAIGLLRDAALLAERDPGEGARPGSPALISLVRELVRMELAQGHVEPALERLVRLEGALAGEADLWALRGNAAQRLGRHRESAEAYLAALKLRPDQPRWMLGAAVSLAADGQTPAAETWAHRARERGALTPELAAYLRQLGVRTVEQ